MLYITGVTHSSVSYPITSIGETFFSILEGMGYYGGVSLKRYGFFGSGGGSVEVRVYPEECKKTGNMLKDGRIEIFGAKIIFSRLNMEIITRKRDLVSKELGLDHNRVSIIEVLDCDGMGFFINIYLKS